MDNRRKHTKRVFAMVLALIMCLSQAVTAAADEVSDNKAVPETVLEESTPEETISEEAVPGEPEEAVSEGALPREPEEAVSGEAVPVKAEPEEAAGDGDEKTSGYFKYKDIDGGVAITGHQDGTVENPVIPDEIDGEPVLAIGSLAFCNWTGMTGQLTIPDSVKTIEDRAFCYCSGLSGSLTIPDSVETIGTSAFSGCSGLDGNLTIGNGVETISNNAFANCSGLSGNLSIGNKVATIGDYAFAYCGNLTGELKIPENVVTIGIQAFVNCSKFTGGLELPDKVETIDIGSFAGCSGLSGNLTIPDNVVTIGDSAFFECTGLTGDLMIGKNVKTIGDGAFKCENCSGFTGTLTIPDKVESIGSDAFKNCYKISKIINNSDCSLPVKCFWKDSDEETICFKNANGNKITDRENGELSKDVYQRKINIPLEAVSLNKANLYLVINESETLSVNVTPETTIHDEVTWSSSDPEVATVSNGVVTAKKRGETFITATTVSGGLTARCNVAVNMYGDLYYEVSGDEVIITGHKDGTGATGSIVIPDEIGGKPVTVISNNAFKDYSQITSVSLGSNVRTIGDYAFYNCANLRGTLTIPNSVVTIGNHAFDLCKFTGTLTLPNTVETIGDSAFRNCSYFSGELSIPNSVVTISNNAFMSCSGFSGSLSIPNSVVTIGKQAFYCCTGLNGTLMLGDHVKTIGNGAFQQCKFTDTLTIPDSVETIGDGAFLSCTGFTGLTIPGSVKTIGDQAFYSCRGFTGDLTIPGSVETIGEDAFFNSGFKGKLTIGDGVKTIGDQAFLSCSDFTGDLVIPDSVESIGDHAFMQCSGFNRNLVIGNGVETIGVKAFYDCYGFTGTISIGSSVKMIGQEAFKGCNNFTGNLVIPDSVESIGDTAFYGWTGFTGSLTIGKGVKKTGARPFDKWYKASAVTNNSSVTDMIFSWFWDYNDSETVCFLSDNGTEITKKGGNIGTGTYVRKVKPSGVSLDRTALDVSTGTSKNLTACVSPANAYDKVSWNSSDKSVATVSDGVITGIKPGNAIITVTTEKGGLSASCNVTVSDKSAIQVTGVSLDKSALNMYPGETETLTATVAPADAADRSVRWFSSNEKVATVDNGKITSVSPGSAVITVSTNDGGFKATCAVRVYTKATAHKVIFKDGETVLYTQTVENGKQATDPGTPPSKPGYIFIGWSDGTSIWNFTTPVNKDLTLIAKYKAEQAVVSENTGSGMDPTPVVDEPEKKGEKTAYKLYLVKGQTFTAGGKGWTTSDKTIAKVAANTGKITAKGKGSAIVTNDTTEYTVYVAAPSVSKNSKTVTVLVGQSAEVGIDLQAVEGKESKYPITWYSANPKVAAVNGGMVTGIAKGSAKVTAYIGGKAYSATVKVIDTCKAPSKIKENKAEFSMNPLQSFNVKFDSNVFTIKNAVWSGNGLKEVKNGYENNVISITKSGKFTAIGPGTTTVTGTDKNSKTVTVTVTVKPISTKGMVYITKGKTDTIKFPKVTNKKADWWKSSDETVATVDAAKKTGKVTGNKYGRSNISCLYKGFTFNTAAYIEDPEMVFGDEKNVPNKKKFEMKIGEMKQFKINQTYQTLNYKSSKQANVFVDENGFVYARKKGKANISTKINGKTYQITIDVKE